MKKAFVIALLWTAGAAAQERAVDLSRGGPALRISLEAAQQRAIENSHRLAEARARGQAAQEAIALHESAERPVVSALAGYTRTNHVMQFFVPSTLGPPRILYPDVPDNYRTRLDLQWPIYSGGRTDALERVARAEASAIAADLAAATADLRLEVARAFWAVVTARVTADVLEESLTRARVHVADVRQRFTVGLVPPNDLSSAEAQQSRQRMLLIEATNQRDLASAELARLIGENLLRPIEPDAQLDLRAPPAIAYEPLVIEAMAGRPEREALERRIEATESQRDVALTALRPSVSVTGGVDMARPNPRIFPRAARWDDSWDASVNLIWPLWDGGRSRAEAAQASAVATAARSRLAEFDSVVALEVRQRLLEIDSGRAAVGAAGDALQAATDARRVVAERYQAGVVTQTDVLDADVALLQAELDLTRALAGVRFAEARLARAVGQ
jgi:outer membrane protein TolC